MYTKLNISSLGRQQNQSTTEQQQLLDDKSSIINNNNSNNAAAPPYESFSHYVSLMNCNDGSWKGSDIDMMLQPVPDGTAFNDTKTRSDSSLWFINTVPSGSAHPQSLSTTIDPPGSRIMTSNVKSSQMVHTMPKISEHNNHHHIKDESGVKDKKVNCMIIKIIHR